MSKQPLLSDFKAIARDEYHLKFIAEKPLEGSLLALIKLNRTILNRRFS